MARINHKGQLSGIAGLWHFRSGLLRQFQFNANSPYEKYCRLHPEIRLEAVQKISITLLGFDARVSFAPIAGRQATSWCFLITVFDSLNGNEIIANYSGMYSLIMSSHPATMDYVCASCRGNDQDVT